VWAASRCLEVNNDEGRFVQQFGFHKTLRLRALPDIYQRSASAKKKMIPIVMGRVCINPRSVATVAAGPNRR